MYGLEIGMHGQGEVLVTACVHAHGSLIPVLRVGCGVQDVEAEGEWDARHALSPSRYNDMLNPSLRAYF